MTQQSNQAVSQLQALGQSLWYDFISRDLLESGEFARLIREDGIRGVTSNPAIFAKAVSGSNAYAAALRATTANSKRSTLEVYEELVLSDIRTAADCLRSVYDDSNRRDGYASLEVSPYLAHDSEGTVHEARRLWQALDRPNVMIKVPATEAGLAAIGTLLTEGININVTLLFSLPVYRQVAATYVSALEERAARGDDPARVASVASFFVSRIDTAFDRLIDSLIARGVIHDVQADLAHIRGQVAIANARFAYQAYRDIFSGQRWAALHARGAVSQRLLWASTGVKNRAYSDVRYVEELIGPETVNTVPPATLEAFRDHGVAESRLQQDVAVAREVMETVRLLGLPCEEVTDGLLREGIALFAEAFDQLLAVVEQQRNAISAQASLQAAEDAVTDRS